MEQQSKKWYVVRAISGKEKKAKEYIESEMAKRGWAEDVPQVLVPTEKIYTIRNGKKVVKDRNYFPGYVLIEADLRDEIIPVIQNLPNVLDFLRESGGGKPIPMRQAEVNRILGIETLLLPATPELACISSSVVRELQHFGQDVTQLLP